jgi:hypothetical protein
MDNSRKRIVDSGAKRPHSQRMKVCCSLLLLALVTGCSRTSQPSAVDQFFVKWLQDHGETNLVVDSSGVGLAGNKTRLHASQYGMKKGPTGYSVEMEFRIRLPEGGPIVEYVAGLGDTTNKATGEAMANFVLTTAHVVYKAFMNPDDPHQRVKSVTVNGTTRQMFAGDMIQMGEQMATPVDLGSMSAKVQDLVTAMPLGAGPHWIKVIYSQHHSQPMVVSANLDNKDADELTAKVQKLNWPARDEFYMVKQFFVIK